MTWLFVALAFVVIGATAVALAGRWRPQGLPPGRPAVARPDPATRFDVVLRGYRMDQVDAELARLHTLLDEATPPAEVPDDARDRTIDS